jgi:hypothetical protein
VSSHERDPGGPAAQRSEATRRLGYAVTAIICTAVVTIPFLVDRAFHRWWEANRPLAPFGGRYRRMQTGYRARQDSLVEEAAIVGAIAGVIAASVPPRRRLTRAASSDYLA